MASDEQDWGKAEFEGEETEVGEPPLTRQQRRLRVRHDGFTPVKQKKFLRALAKYGTVKDACRKVEVSTTTAYRTRELLPAFAKQWDAALDMAATELEAVAFKRATEGTEEKVIRDGKVVQTRVKPSDSILKLMLQGTNPEKYGGTMGRPSARERLRKDEAIRMEDVRRVISADVRKKIEEQEEERIRLILADKDSAQAARERTMKRFERMRRRDIAEGRYIEAPDKTMVKAGHALLRYEDVPPGTPVLAALAPRPDLWPIVHVQYKPDDPECGTEEWYQHHDGRWSNAAGEFVSMEIELDDEDEDEE